MSLARVKTWTSEVLTATDLNAEFNNILNDINASPIIAVDALTLATNDFLQWSGSAWANKTPVQVSNSIGAPILLTTLTAAASASLAYTAITTTYRKYQFEFLDLLPATDNVSMSVTFSSDGGANYDTGGHYNFMGNYATESGSGAIVSVATGSAFSIGSTAAGNLSNTAPFSGTMELFRPATSQALHEAHVRATYLRSGADHYVHETIGLAYANNVAINAIKFQMGSGNIISGAIAVYGIL